jgi:flavin reductase (DIM6/NTAB) family NADH-FMN oxidoreductase RutF
MQKISFMESLGLSGPHPFGMLVTRAADGKLNVMSISWFTFLSLAEPKMALAISAKGYTNEVLKATKKASLCLAGEKLKIQGMQCGGCSGREVDKAEAFHLEFEEAEGIGIPVLKHAALSWALELAETIETGDHTLFICNITATAANPQDKHLLAFDAYSRLNTF